MIRMAALAMAWVVMLSLTASTAPRSAVARDDAAATPLGDRASRARLRRIFEAELSFVWRTVRRLGVADEDLDDAVQQVFVVVSRRIDDIRVGKERSFLFGTARRVAADMRRKRGGYDEVTYDDLAAPASAGAGVTTPDAGELIDRKRARMLLDEVLASMPDGVREVFTLFELEGMTMAEVAQIIGVPQGTVASRIRKAREIFYAAAKRIQARETAGGGR